MSVTLIGEGDVCHLFFEGNLTIEFAREIEDRIIEALRRYTRFEVDLSAVRDIDICGIHLLGLLRTMGGENMRIVAPSPVVERATRRFFAGSRGADLLRAARGKVGEGASNER